MIKPVAARLRSLLEEDPSRSSCSLLITGHSAGGAVASLLYAHMMTAEVESELNILTDCKKALYFPLFSRSICSSRFRLQTCALHNIRRPSCILTTATEADNP